MSPAPASPGSDAGNALSDMSSGIQLEHEKSEDSGHMEHLDNPKEPEWGYDPSKHGPREAGGSTQAGFLESDGFSHETQAKSAYFDYASEKSLSHTESKLFFQRHQMEKENSKAETDIKSPLSRTRTLSSNAGDDHELNRTASITSRRSGKLYHSKDQSRKLPCQVPESNMLPASGTEDPSYISKKGDAFMVENDESHEETLSGAMEVPGFHTPPLTGSDISPEMTAIARKIKGILALREKYINISLQGPGHNPKDDTKQWTIYPPPPNPTWNEKDKSRPISQSEANESEIVPYSPVIKGRKQGQNIGQDFDMRDLEPLPAEDSEIDFSLDASSIYQIFQGLRSLEDHRYVIEVPTLNEFYRDMNEVQNVSSDGPTKSFAYRQLDILEGKFHLYNLESSYQEMADCKKVPHRDFYNVRKVDTHVHHSACMNQKHLLRFIKSKMKKSPEETVLFRDDKHLNLREVFDSINLTAYDLSIDTLDMHAHTDSFHRFDKFNLKYNPVGESRLREIFLKTDNYIKGRYLAEITKEVISDLESSKYQFVEWRLSIYGRSLDEWDKLSAWVIDNKLVSHNVRWLIQIPRLYSMYKESHQVENFEEIIVNIFRPLYEVTKNPRTHPKLHVFLQRVVGFDSVDDESKIETRLYRKFPQARDWDTRQNPPYTYWIYHLFANMTSLNAWRQRRGFNTFVLRPHCGEAGDVDHLAAAALCCHSISHGLLLRKVPLLQYIFYLDQIGIAMSPLSNNALFLAYDRNPFLKYFKRGLNVSLSTDDPLQFAFTKEPLIEEYSVAAQIYRLSAVDMCELAQHSVVQSGFEHELKQRWLGQTYNLPGIQGNNVAKSNVPNIRENFRLETLDHEHQE